MAKMVLDMVVGKKNKAGQRPKRMRMTRRRWERRRRPVEAAKTEEEGAVEKMEEDEEGV